MIWELFKKKKVEKDEQGETNNEARKEKNPKAEKMLQYMKDKYQEEFTAGLYQEANWAYNYNAMSVLSDKFPGEFIEVREVGRNQFSDSYLGYLYREENARRIQEIATKLYGKCKVISEACDCIVPVKFSAETSFEEYMSFAKSSVSSKIFVDYTEKDRDFEGLFEALTQMLDEKDMKQDINIFVMREEIDLNSITRKSLYDMLDTLYSEKWFLEEGYILYGENGYTSSKWEVY